MDDQPLFGRVAEVTIDKLKLTGFDVRFDIAKSIKPQPNTCKIHVFNLNSDHRAQLEELRPKAEPGTKAATKGIPTKLDAGYGNRLSQLWLGDLRTINSIREGSNWQTTLESGDGEKAWVNARLHVSYGPKTPVETALKAMIAALGVGEGNVAKVLADLQINGMGKLFSQGLVISGSVATELTAFARSADLEWSIQDGSIQFTNRGKALAGKAVKLSSTSGMIGSPTVDADGLLTVKMQMIPDVRPGTLIVMDAERIKGNYRIEKGTWSGDTVAGEWSITAVCKRY